MQLYNKLKKYSLKDIVNLEENDRQFLALVDLYENKLFDDEHYLFLTIANALVCYQLSGKGEDYWEEFSRALQNKKIGNFSNVELFFKNFLYSSKNNKRLVDIKLKRIKKLESFYNLVTENSCDCPGQVNDTVSTLLQKMETYYKNMDKLVCDLSKTMNQKTDAKTIVFAVKMFGYASRNVFDCLEYFPSSIGIPIDSRLEKLYHKYNINKDGASKKDIQKFYNNLSKKLNISPLHLDAILWINYDHLIIKKHKNLKKYKKLNFI